MVRTNLRAKYIATSGNLTTIDRKLSVRFPKHLEAKVITEPEMASSTKVEQPIHKAISFGLENLKNVRIKCIKLTHLRS
jgi:hypothetical protein